MHVQYNCKQGHEFEYPSRSNPTNQLALSKICIKIFYCFILKNVKSYRFNSNGFSIYFPIDNCYFLTTYTYIQIVHIHT